MQKIFLIFFAFVFVSCGHSVKVGEMEFLSKAQLIDWRYLKKYDTLNALPYKDSIENDWYNNEYSSPYWDFIGNMDELNIDNWNCEHCDKFLKGILRISGDDFAENVWYAEFASDDGMWIYINGKSLGHWGGDVRQVGTVNLRPDGSFDKLPKFKIPKEYLKQGENIINIHVTESIGKELVYFKLWMSPF